jgi:hypothetical protein
VSEANQREHWAARHRRRARQRAVVLAVLRATFGRAPALPAGHGWAVALTRIAPRRLDVDNAVSSLKACVDAVSDWCSIDDGDARFAWSFAQEKPTQPRYYAVRLQLQMVTLPR